MPTTVPAVDHEIVRNLVVDDEVIDLLKVGNEAEVRAEVGSDTRSQAFTYPQAKALSTEWSQRLRRVSAWYAAASQTSQLVGPADALWRRELERQDDYLNLARDLARGVYIDAANIMRRLYGTPTVSEFHQALGEIRQQAQELASDTAKADVVRGAADRLLQRLGLFDDVPDVLPEPLPSVELVTKVADWYRPAMEVLWAQAGTLDLPDECGAVEVARLFTLLLERTGINVAVTDEVTAVTFQPSQQRVAIPPERAMSRLKLLKTLLPHEWVHIMRYLNGLQLSGLTLAAFGLPGYLTFEEGVATGLTAAVGKKDPAKAVTSYARPEAMVAISLAAGLHQQTGPWTRWSLYNLFYDHYRLEKLVLQKQEIDEAKAHESANHQAMTRVIRTLRGTLGANTRTYAGADASYCPRDLSYRRGNLAFWRWAEANSDSFDQLLLAKADLTDPLHYQFVKSIGTPTT